MDIQKAKDVKASSDVQNEITFFFEFVHSANEMKNCAEVTKVRLKYLMLKQIFKN